MKDWLFRKPLPALQSSDTWCDPGSVTWPALICGQSALDLAGLRSRPALYVSHIHSKVVRFVDPCFFSGSNIPVFLQNAFARVTLECLALVCLAEMPAAFALAVSWTRIFFDSCLCVSPLTSSARLQKCQRRKCGCLRTDTSRESKELSFVLRFNLVE